MKIVEVQPKTDQEIQKMRRAGALAAKALQYAISLVKPGISTNYIDTKVDKWIRKHGGFPAAYRYGETDDRPAFPKSICMSVNEVICHGIPGKYKLRNGDIVGIDVALFLDGYIGDTASTVPVGKVSDTVREFLSDAYGSMLEGISVAQAGKRLLDIGRAIQEHAEEKGYGVVEGFVGHGVGTEFHELPQVSHVAKLRGEHDPSQELMDCELIPGMTFTVEPMINEGTWSALVMDDGWTVVTEDRKLSAQYEHTILITEEGSPEILTLLPDNQNRGPGGFQP